MQRFLSRTYKDFFFGLQGKTSIMASAQGGVEGSVRLLLTKNCKLLKLPQLPGTLYLVWTVGRGPGRQLTLYRAPSFMLTVLWGARGTQRAVNWGLVLFGWRATRCLPSASPHLREPEIVTMKPRAAPRASARASSRARVAAGLRNESLMPSY